jgi:hypothetical protein
MWRLGFNGNWKTAMKRSLIILAAAATITVAAFAAPTDANARDGA